MTLAECEEKNIKTFADNDGGLWFWNESGSEKVEEDQICD